MRRSALDAWIESQAIDAAGDAQDDEFEREMARRALVATDEPRW